MDLLGQKSRQLAFVLGVLSLFLGPFQSAFAQVAGGTILGAVSDSSGAIVSNAEVAIKDVATDVVRTVMTNSAGFYAVPNLLPGRYEIRVSAPGFTVGVASGVAVAVGAEQVVNITLKVGAANATVDVADVTAGVELATSAINAQVDGETVRDLPLNGRDWTELATLEPGVNSIRNQATVGSNGSSDATKATRGFGNQLSVSGTRSSQNNYRVDGVSINDYTNDAPGGVLGTLSGVDAIQEFSVLTTNYSAEYGKTSGGVINAITRSGSNRFHGDAYEFLRNSALDARNYFDGSTIPPFKRNQFGGAIGGPIRKDSTFFFVDYERVRQLLNVTDVSPVLSQNARSGILSSGNVTVDPAIVPYLSFWPLPNVGLPVSGDTGFFSVPTLQNGTQNFITARIDQKFSAKDSLSGTFLLDRTSLSQPDPLNNEHFESKNSRPFVSLEETHIFSSAVVNSLRFGFSRNGAATSTADAINPLAAQTSLGSVPERPAAEISVPGLFPFFGGLGGFPYFTFGWNSFQLYDDAFLTHGAHSLKFGFALERMQSNNLFDIGANGSFRFNSVSDFLTNQPANFGTYVGTPTFRGLRETLLAGYIQDDWRLRSNLTLNLGLRYEVTTVPTEVNGKLSTLRNMTDTQVHIGNPYFNNPTLKDFERRVGFAWDPFRTGKTSVRGGIGLYDVLPLPYEFLSISSNADAPFSANTSISAGNNTTTNLQQGDFPTNAYNKAIAQFSPTSLLTQRVAYVQPNPSRSYVTQWNFNIQQELAPHVVGTIAYVGSRGIHLPFRTDDSDIVLPTKTSAGYVWPYATSTFTPQTLNPNVARIDRLDWTAESSYHSLQASAKIAPGHDLQLQTSYTWGKSIDTSSATIGGDQYTNSPSSLPVWFDPRTRRGVSDFNLGQNLVVSGTWQLPGLQSKSGAAAWAVNGWQLGGILQVSSGAPFSVLMGGDPLGLGNTDPFAYPNRLSGPGCNSLVNPGSTNYVKVQCFSAPTAPSQAFYNQYCNPANPFPTCLNLLGNAGRNTLTGPGLVNTDFSIFKNNRIPAISEAFNIQFRAEFFNVFNRTNFAPPLDNNTILDQSGNVVGSAGVLTATATTSRQIQFGLKVIF
jgi:hypothetical protein